MRTTRLPVVDWTDSPADLNGLVHCAERPNLVSARVPSHFKHSLPSDRLVTADRYKAFFICIYRNDLVYWDRIKTEFQRARLMVFESKLLTKLVGTWDGVTEGQRKLQRERDVHDVSSTILTHLFWFIQTRRSETTYGTYPVCTLDIHGSVHHDIITKWPTRCNCVS